jgi:iron complex outermembrane receptor protein
LLPFLLVGVAVAQQKQIEGIVTEASTATPLPGVNVVIEGSNVGTATDPDGRYQIEVPGPEAVLVFTFVGYQTERVEVGDREVIDVSLREEVGALEEVVVTGYGSQERRDISGAVSSVDVSPATAHGPGFAGTTPTSSGSARD